ncbi:MAG: TonB-dependent receptor [Bacteroidota bacterium]
MKLTTMIQPLWLLFLAASWGLLFSSPLQAFDREWREEPNESRPLNEALEELGEKYEVFFSYNTSLVSVIKVDFQYQPGEMLDQAMKRLLANTTFDYKVYGEKYFLVFEKSKKGIRDARKLARNINRIQKIENKGNLKVQPNRSNPISKIKSTSNYLLKKTLEKTISGTVTGAEGIPLVGAAVRARGTNQGALTNEEGKYQITVADEITTLIISYFGYETMDVRLDGRSEINVSLTESAASLNEVVVVGYGTQGKSKVSAAISQVNAEALEIEKRPVTNVQNSLVGAVPGLIINQNSGRLGSDINLRVRAVSALEEKNALVLIDGFEGSINDVNPADIASVSVLKDAAATAIYGARSANGVILITTKNTGRSERMSVSYNVNYSRQSPAQTAQLAKSQEFMEFSNEAAIGEALRNDPSLTPGDVSVPFSDADISRAASGFYPETAWVDELYSENAGQASHNVTINGGSDRVGYFFNMGYLNQNGLLVGSDNFRRYNLRLKLDADVTDWLTIGANASNSIRNTNNVPSVESNNVRGRPFFPIQLSDGTYVDKGAAGGEANPLGRATSGSYNKQKNDALNLQLYAELNPIDNLYIEGRVSYTNTNAFQETWNTPYEYALLDLELNQVGENIPVNAADRNLLFSSAKIFSINTLTTARYELSLGDKHSINILAGLQTQEGESVGLQADRSNFILPAIQNLTLGQTINGFGNSSTRGDNRKTLSYFGRLAYDYMAKYLVEFNFRADASSNFGPANRWGYFPAVSVGWNVTEEGFMDNANFVDVLKLRGSWGQNGDDGSINVVERVAFNPSGIAFGGVVAPTLNLGSAVNPNLRWETSEKINLGLDLVMWKGKLGLTAEYFVDNRSDIITQLLTSAEGGLDGVLDNVYDARSWGYEAELSHNNTVGKVSYFATANLTYYDSEITNTEGVSPLNNSNTNFQDIGLPVFGNWFGYETNGFFNNQSDLETNVAANGDPIDQSAVSSHGDEFGRYIGGFRYVDQLTVDTDGDSIPDAADGVINADDRVVLKENTQDNYRIGFNLGVSYAGFSLSARVYGVLRGFQWWRNGVNLNPFTGDVAPFVYQMDTWRPDNMEATFPEATASNVIPYNQNVSHLIQNNAYIKLKNVNLSYTFNRNLLEKLKLVSGLDVYVSVENIGVLWTNNPSFDTGWDPELGTGTFRYPLPLTTAFGANIKF